MYLEIHVQPGPLSWSLAPTCTSIVSAPFFEVWPQHVVGTRIVPAAFLQVWPQLVTYKHSPGPISWSLAQTCCTAYMKMHSGLTFRKNRKKSGPGPTILNFSRGPIISTRGAHNFYKGGPAPRAPPLATPLSNLCPVTQPIRAQFYTLAALFFRTLFCHFWSMW